MAWNWSGKNWEGRNFNTPMSLRSLGGQVDAEYPSRPRTADGTVASEDHDKDSPTSDHRPHPIGGAGIVRAIDITVTPAQGDQITETLRLSRDRRIKYVIWNRRSFRPPTWVWKPYNLAPHDKHFHLSTNSNFDSDARSWQLGATQLPQPANPQENDDMWQYLNIDETLIRHAWAQGWLQPKSPATLEYFLTHLAELQEATAPASFAADWLAFRRAVSNGIARGGAQGPPGTPGTPGAPGASTIDAAARANAAAAHERLNKLHTV